MVCNSYFLPFLICNVEGCERKTSEVTVKTPSHVGHRFHGAPIIKNIKYIYVPCLIIPTTVMIYAYADLSRLWWMRHKHDAVRGSWGGGECGNFITNRLQPRKGYHLFDKRTEKEEEPTPFRFFFGEKHPTLPGSASLRINEIAPPFYQTSFHDVRSRSAAAAAMEIRLT